MDVGPVRRLQLTLFVPPPMAGRLDRCRQRFDPLMAARLRAHVTVLRRVLDLEALETVARSGSLPCCRLRLLDVRQAPPEHGGGIYVAVDDPFGDFDQLSSRLAPAMHDDDRAAGPLPHVTLLHPRTTTARARRAALEEIAPGSFAGEMEVRCATLIGETRDRWVDIVTYELGGRARPASAPAARAEGPVTSPSDGATARRRPPCSPPRRHRPGRP